VGVISFLPIRHREIVRAPAREPALASSA
jgi:hypothetical protein